MATASSETPKTSTTPTQSPGGAALLLKRVGTAGVAAVLTVSVIHPIDMVKTRIQVASGNAPTGVLGTVKKVIASEGVGAFWKGIPAAWLREASYTSIRLGLYQPCKDLVGADTFPKRFLAAAMAGGIGSIVGNPFDVLKTKMMTMSDGKPSFGAAASSLYKGQGFVGFYRGLDFNIARAMTLNGTKMATYDTIKQMLVNSGYGFEPKSLVTQFFAAFGAGFFMTCTVAPFDMIRTQLMNQPSDARIYKNGVDCLVKTVKAAGTPLVLWTGFIPIWSRFAPNSVLQLMLFEQLSEFVGLRS